MESDVNLCQVCQLCLLKGKQPFCGRALSKRHTEREFSVEVSFSLPKNINKILSAGIE